MSRTSRFGALVAATALLATTFLAPAAQAAPSSTAGLYGAADPTYDGVFRQSLAISGLVAVGARPAPAPVAWLLSQQCADGGFMSYRADLGAACTRPDPQAFAGEETNATATALMALTALGRSAPAARAERWLLRAQQADGGWSYYPGGASDANSTGLVLAALRAAGGNARAIEHGARYLGSLALRCASGGGLKYQDGGAANASATAQAFAGLAGPLPVAGPRALAGAESCGRSVTSKAAAYLIAKIAATGTVPSAFGGGADHTSTAFAVLGFVSRGTGKATVAKATAGLKSGAKAYVGAGNSPAALGLLLMVAEATGSSPRAFGGLDLVRSLQSTARR